jgi:hypothetical protein
MDRSGEFFGTIDQVTNSGGNTLCYGDSTVLSQPVDSNTNCQWLKDGASPIAGETGFSYTVKTSGVYALKLTNGCGSLVCDTIQISVLPQVSASISAAGFSICSGDSMLLTAPSGSGLTYTWYLNGSVVSGANSASYQSNSRSNLPSGGMNSSGCTGVSSDFVLTENQKPKAVVIPSGSTSFCGRGLCSAEWYTRRRIELSVAQKRNGYYRSNKPGFPGDDHQHGDPSVLVLNASGCSAVSSVKTVTVNPIPTKPTITATGNTLNAPAGYSYVWLKNGNIISGAINADLQLTDTGCYQVQVSDANGCSNVSDTLCIQSLSTGISAIRMDQINIFPNPGTDVFHILGLSSGSRITVYNATGQHVMQWRADGATSLTIDAAQWPAGVYLFRLEMGGNYVQKSVIQNDSDRAIFANQ